MTRVRVSVRVYICVFVCVETRVSQVKSNVYKVEQASDQNCGRVR
jgi:hypothetical protein